MHDDDHTHDWTSPTKAAAWAEMDRFRNLGLKNYKLGCRCQPYQILVTSKKKYTAGVDLVGERCVWTCTCPGGREPQRRTKRRKKGAAALPASRAEMDRFRNLGLKNYKLGCRCEPCQKLVTSKKKYTAGVDLVGDRCVWTCTCPGGREPQRRTKRRKKGAGALPASAAAAPARVEEAIAAVPAVQAQQPWRLLAVLAEEATNPAPAEGVASFAVLAPVAAAAVPTLVAATSYAVAPVRVEKATAAVPAVQALADFDLLGQEPLWD